MYKQSKRDYLRSSVQRTSRIRDGGSITLCVTKGIERIKTYYNKFLNIYFYQVLESYEKDMVWIILSLRIRFLGLLDTITNRIQRHE